VPIQFTPEHIGALSEDVTLTDNALNVAGPQQSIAVSGTARAADLFSVTTKATVAAGTSFTITITALSTSNHTVTTYNGTVTFTSSDPLFVNPGPITLSGGVGQATVTLKTTGTQTITATDTVTPALTGSGELQRRTWARNAHLAHPWNHPRHLQHPLRLVARIRRLPLLPLHGHQWARID